MKKLLLSVLSLTMFIHLSAQQNPEAKHGFKFEQLGTALPSPNAYRGADGAPGADYWQQKVDYVIECSLNTKEQRLDGVEKVTYTNNAPTSLKYLWLQLDENEHDPHKSEAFTFNQSSMRDIMSEGALSRLEKADKYEKYGCRIDACTDASGNKLDYTINGTVMRIELPMPLKTGETFDFTIDWHYFLTNRIESGGRGGYEHFDDNDNYIYTITQWFPRLCVYSDHLGWQNKQFVGRGEFALEFGDYDVKITVPDDHMVGSTGECQNYEETLTSTEYGRWQRAQTASEPIEIVTLAEAKALETAPRSSNMVTWHYKAENVRDFAWTASPKFVWDAMAHTTTDGSKVMCMSYYAKEAYPIYSRYSTKATDHTLNVYSRMTFPYPYPVAISVEAASGMEYPMICFNPGRAEDDGTYTERAKYAALTVIIHEVGHNYFPMIVSNDERQWAWMDEGINSFLQFVAETEFDAEYKHWFTAPMDIADYMSGSKDQLEPIMTNSENIKNYGSNAYDKPAGALNILRETVMGRELFDYAFREYSQRWMFKHPEPADFFRTMEDASGVDLDWFWRGWFYGTDAVDISLDSITWYKVDLKNDPEPSEYSVDYPIGQRPSSEPHISKRRLKEAGFETAADKDPELLDFYSKYDPWATGDTTITYSGTRYAETFSKKEKKKMYGDKNYYELNFSNKGGLVMPVIIEWTFEDGTTEIERIPVNIWRKNEDKFTKVFVKNKEVKGIVIDPYGETADIDLENNNWPVKELPSKFQVFKANKNNPIKNPMQKAKVIRP